MKKIILLSLMSLLISAPFATTWAQTYPPNQVPFTTLQSDLVYTIKSANGSTSGGRALEVGGGGNLYNTGGIDVWTPYAASNQQWTFEPINLPNGTYVIRNRDTKKVLTNAGLNQIPIQDFIYGSPSQSQIWVVEGPSLPAPSNQGDKLRIRPVGSSLQLEQTDYSQVKCTSNTQPNQFYLSDYQWWYIKDVSTNPSKSYPAASFQIINNNSGKALSASPDGYNSVGQMTAWSLSREEWTFSAPNANGYVQIINRNTLQVLEIGGGGDLTQPGVKADIWENYNGLNQQWALLDINDSHILTVAEATDGRTFKIWNPNSGKILEIGGGGLNDGDSANQWYDYSHPWQQWHVQFDSFNATSSPSDPDANGSSVNPASKQPVNMKSENAAVEIYPNPVHDILSFTSANIFDPASIKLTDVRGVIVPAHYQNGRIDVSSLPAGLYMVTVSDGHKIYHHKFVKD